LEEDPLPEEIEVTPGTEATPAVAPATPAVPAPVAPAPVAPVVEADPRDVRIAELERSIAVGKITAAVSDPKVGARDAGVIAGLIDATKAATAEGLAAEVARVKAAHPALFFGPGSADGGARGDNAVEADGNTWFRQALNK